MIELDSLISILHEGVELYSPKSGYLLDLNDRACKIFGVNKENILKSKVSIFNNPNFPEKLKKAFRQKKQIRTKISYAFDKVKESHYYESWYKHKVIYLQAFGLPIVDNGMDMYILIIKEAATKQKTHSVESLRVKKIMDRFDRLKTAFVANVMHEVRTPLNAVVGFSQLIKDAETQEEREEYAKIILKNTELLLERMDAVIDLSDIKADNVKQNKQQIYLSAFFDVAFMSMKEKLNNKEVHLIPDNPYKSCLVSMDKNRVLRVAAYLVSDFLAHIKKGYVKIGYRCAKGGFYAYVEGAEEEMFTKKQKSHYFISERKMTLCKVSVCN